MKHIMALSRLIEPIGNANPLKNVQTLNLVFTYLWQGLGLKDNKQPLSIYIVGSVTG